METAILIATPKKNIFAVKKQRRLRRLDHQVTTTVNC